MLVEILIVGQIIFDVVVGLLLFYIVDELMQRGLVG